MSFYYLLNLLVILEILLINRTIYRAELVKELNDKYNLTLKSGYSASRGFYLHMIANGRKINELPQEFLKPLKNKNSIIFTTYEMVGI